MSDEGSTDIEGATGAALDLWKAKEATRQGDAKLSHQSQSFDGLRMQATSLLGWSVTIGTALTAVAFNGKSTLAGTAIVSMTSISAAFSISVLWVTHGWRHPSYNPDQISEHPETSELRVLQSLATGTQQSVLKNKALLKTRATRLKCAWISFAATPTVGLAVYLLAR